KDLVLTYVLQNFLPEETVWLDKLLPAVAEALPLLLAGQDSAFMSKAALLIDPPPPRLVTRER
ncbi:MAG: aminoacyl-tRNA hydrolase, partial [Aliidongia sp.]